MGTLINLPRIVDERGNLSFFENYNPLPFDISNVYWIYDVKAGESFNPDVDGNLAYCVIALSGSFDIKVDTADGVDYFFLNKSFVALYLPELISFTIENLSTNAVCLIVNGKA